MTHNTAPKASRTSEGKRGGEAGKMEEQRGLFLFFFLAYFVFVFICLLASFVIFQFESFFKFSFGGGLQG